MNRNTLVFIALAYSMLYGVCAGVFELSTPWRALGAVVCAILWIAVGMFGRDGAEVDRRRGGTRS